MSDREETYHAVMDGAFALKVEEMRALMDHKLWDIERRHERADSAIADFRREIARMQQQIIEHVHLAPSAPAFEIAGTANLIRRFLNAWDGSRVEAFLERMDEWGMGGIPDISHLRSVVRDLREAVDEDD